MRTIPLTMDDFNALAPMSKTQELRNIVNDFAKSGLQVIELIDDKQHYSGPKSFLASVRGVMRSTEARMFVDLITRNDRVFLVKKRSTGKEEKK